METQAKVGKMEETITVPIETSTTTEYRKFTKDEYIEYLLSVNNDLYESNVQRLQEGNKMDVRVAQLSQTTKTNYAAAVKYEEANKLLREQNEIIRKMDQFSQQVATNFIQISTLRTKQISAMSKGDNAAYDKAEQEILSLQSEAETTVALRSGLQNGLNHLIDKYNALIKTW